MDSKLETALLEAIQKISEAFGPKAVLRGGMALRLQGISRSTIDVDFAFQPTVSKKSDFGDQLVEVVQAFSDSPVQVSYHSTVVQLIASINQTRIMVEGTTSDAFEPQLISTAPIALKLKRQPALVSIMPNDMALAHKCAAWLERRLIRDLYDIYILYDRLLASPNLRILEKRLSEVNYVKGVMPKITKPNLETFTAFLKTEVNKLNDRDIEHELDGLIDPRELLGIGMLIKNTIRGISFKSG